MSGLKPLVDNETTKKEVDKGPDIFNPVSCLIEKLRIRVLSGRSATTYME